MRNKGNAAFEAQSAIKDAIERICAKYDDHYWLRIDESGKFPDEFVADIAAGGWLGVAMPERHGGAGLGLTEAALMMQTVAQSGAGFSGASAIHLNIFGLMPIVKFGTEEQQARFLPPAMDGTDKACFAVAHPLAKAWAELEAADLMAFKAAALYDAGRECGAEANAAKYLGGEAGFSACEAAVLAHGGMGYAKEYFVERYFREAMIARIAPVSREMILNYIAERVLGLPKSY